MKHVVFPPQGSHVPPFWHQEVTPQSTLYPVPWQGKRSSSLGHPYLGMAGAAWFPSASDTLVPPPEPVLSLQQFGPAPAWAWPVLNVPQLEPEAAGLDESVCPHRRKLCHPPSMWLSLSHHAGCLRAQRLLVPHLLTPSSVLKMSPPQLFYRPQRCRGRRLLDQVSLLVIVQGASAPFLDF